MKWIGEHRLFKPLATDQQKHLADFEFEGFSTGDGTNYMVPEVNSDTKAPFEHQTSTGSDGLTAQGVNTLIRAGGTVMPRAGVVKRITGWGTGSGTSSTVYINFMKWTPTRNDNSNITPVILDSVEFDCLGNTKVEDFDETTITTPEVAKGDILYTQIKTADTGVGVYFNATVEIKDTV